MHTPTGSVAAALLTLLALGCEGRKEPTPTPTPSATAPSAAAATGSAPTASASAAPRARPATCEVEAFGSFDVPKDAPKGKTVVYVAQDDCMSDSAHMLGHIPGAPSGTFVIEVFPKWATDVTICGALEKPDGTAEYYGKAINKDNGGKFHAETEGEVMFNDVKLVLKKGPPRKFQRETK